MHQSTPPSSSLSLLHAFSLPQATRDALVRHKQEFGDLLGKENLVALIIDGPVGHVYLHVLKSLYHIC